MLAPKSLILMLALLACILDANAREKIPVSVYVYHLKPPYIIDIETETGLYYDFSRYLNTHAGKYEFHTLFIPRKRAEIYLKNKRLDGVLLGVNPTWFQDKDQTKYLWTAPIFEDQDELISLTHSPFEYSGPQSLIGKKLGGVLGFYYFGIDTLVKEGKIQRSNTSGEKSVLSMVLAGHVDVGIVSRSTFHYLTIKEGWHNKFHISLKPHDIYSRHILIPRKQKAVHDYLAPILNKLNKDPNWQRILKKYY